MKIVEYKEYVNQNDNQDLTNQELLEMANVDFESTGLENIVIWIGPNPGQHGHRIKIGNKVNSFDGGNNFTLTIPEFKVIGKVNTKLIDSRTMDRIIEFVNMNIDLIIQYSEYRISTKNLLDNLIAV